MDPSDYTKKSNRWLGNHSQENLIVQNIYFYLLNTKLSSFYSVVRNVDIDLISFYSIACVGSGRIQTIRGKTIVVITFYIYFGA